MVLDPSPPPLHSCHIRGVYAHVSTYIRTCTHMYICIHTCICIYIYTCLNVFVFQFVCMHACMYEFMYCRGVCNCASKEPCFVKRALNSVKKKHVLYQKSPALYQKSPDSVKRALHSVKGAHSHHGCWACCEKGCVYDRSYVRTSELYVMM